jgi:hypothetical protein
VNRAVWLGSFATALLLACAAVRAQEGVAYHGDQIPPEVENVYVKGLQFLVRSQDAEGSWSRSGGESGPGITGLALLAILAHGEDPNYGPYADTVRRAVESLLKSQDERTGYLGSSMYHHGFATLALAEAYGAVRNPKLGPALRKAVDLILTSQKQNPHGGWRYSPNASDADTTVSGAQMVALLAARNAGIAVPDEAIKKGLEYYRSCQEESGGIGYTNPGGGNTTRTAIATLVAALSKRKDTHLFNFAWNFLKTGRGYHEGSYYFYTLYYQAQALFQADMQEWRVWNEQNFRELKSVQSADGSWAGQYGTAFCTSAALLSMALNYRFLPIYER